jgi:hypothetical protein
VPSRGNGKQGEGVVRRTLIGVAVIAAAGAVLYFATVRLAGVECEVCVEGGGARVCRTVAGPTESEATGTALSNACAVLGRNVTERLGCERREPASVACRAP